MTSIAPWLAVDSAREALAYYQAAFSAVELGRLEHDTGEVVIAHLAIDGAEFWIQSDIASSPRAGAGVSVRLILKVDDPDAVFARAVAAGATEVAPITVSHGWRVGRVVDPCGHHWEIGKRLAT
ncbi:MAG TPA: VOC family protein [Ktedonobacterales bacterium]|jgi:PhnB protein